MRVTSGLYKGHKIDEVKSIKTRPTQDKIRQAIFNMLYQIDGNVLDLFAGTGSLGIESLSRGADLVYFIDHNDLAIETIKKNVSKYDQNKIKIKKMDYLTYLKNNELLFKYIFIDPPYDFNNYDELVKKLDNHLLKGGYLIIELLKNIDIDFDEIRYQLDKNKIYGIKKIIILKKIS